VIAVERSPAALAWLRRNAAAFPRVEVVEGEVGDPALLSELHGAVDVLLCNPPYVPAGTAVRFEPGVEREVDAVPLGGRRVVPGLTTPAPGHLDGPGGQG
jgi:release factor glutamine methyltransferase